MAVRDRFRDAAGGNIQDAAEAAVAAEIRGDVAVAVFHGADDRRARAVAEKYARRAVLPVHEAGEHFRADDEDVLIEPAPHELRRQRDPVNIAGASRGEIHRPRMGTAELCLYEARRGRNHIVRRRGAYHDEINVVRRESRLLQSRFGRGDAQVGRIFAVRRDVPGLDPRARADPVIRSFHHSFQIFIGKNLFRRIMARRQNACG